MLFYSLLFPHGIFLEIWDYMWCFLVLNLSDFRLSVWYFQSWLRNLFILCTISGSVLQQITKISDIISRPQSAAAAAAGELISALLSCSQSFQTVCELSARLHFPVSLAYITQRYKLSAVYLSAASLRIHNTTTSSSGELLSGLIRFFSRSPVRQVATFWSESGGGAHRIMVEKSNGESICLTLHCLSCARSSFMLSSPSFPSAMCWKKKICTLQRERNKKKKVAVYLHHIPFPKRRRRRRRRRRKATWAPWVSDIWELEGNPQYSPSKGTTNNILSLSLFLSQCLSLYM